MELTDLTFNYTKGLPTEESYNLTSQINRCSCSVPSNIAEGSGKRTNLHFAEFLSTSLSSSYELETQLLICKRRNYGDEELLNKAMDLTIEVQRMIYNFREKILNDEKS